jgi:NitT/TauT family transport system permease protein
MAPAGTTTAQGGRSAAHVFRPLAGVLAFLVLWEAVSRSGLVDSRSAPPPSAVFVTLVRILGERMFAADVLCTALSWLIAVVLATVAGVVVGLALGSLRRLRAAGLILVGFLLPLPGVALIPLAISLIGTGAQAKVTLAVFASVWPVLHCTLRALGELDPTFTEVARSYRVTRWRTVLWVTIPAILASVLTGVRCATSIALLTLISTEFLTGGSGLGQFLLRADRLAEVLAGVAVAGLLGLLANLLITAAQRRLRGRGYE